MNDIKKFRILCVPDSLHEIGQVKKENAIKEIERLEKETNKKWTFDDSPFIYRKVNDSYNMNPCRLSKGYVWVVVADAIQYEYWSEEEIKKEKEYYLDYEFDLK